MGIGLWEILLLMGIALVVMGPEKFPDFAKLVFRTVRELRGYVDEMKRDISKELKPVQKELNDLQRYNPEQYIDALARETKGPANTASKPASAPASTAGTPASQPAATPGAPSASKQDAPAADQPAGATKPYHNPYIDGGDATTSTPSSTTTPSPGASKDASEAGKPKPGVRPSTPPPDSRPADGYDD